MPPNSKEMSKGSVFEFFSIEWLDTFSTSFKESTYIRYRTLIRCYLMPYFPRQQKVESITKEHVLDFCKEIETHGKRDGTALSTKTVSDILSVLRRILHYAKAQNIPVDSAIFWHTDKTNTETLARFELVRTVDASEISNRPPRLFVWISASSYVCSLVSESESCVRWHGTRFLFLREIFVFAKRCSAFRLEYLNLQKTHILISSPKSSSANRTIPVSHMLFEYLNMYPLGKTGYFLSGSSSRLIEPRCVQRRFHKHSSWHVV